MPAHKLVAAALGLALALAAPLSPSAQDAQKPTTSRSSLRPNRLTIWMGSVAESG